MKYTKEQLGKDWENDVRLAYFSYTVEGGAAIAKRNEGAAGIAFGDNGERKYFISSFKGYGLGAGASTSISLNGGIITGIDDPDNLKKNFIRLEQILQLQDLEVILMQFLVEMGKKEDFQQE